ncbi:putative metallothionein [Schizophyllum commune H4-8]|nr:putative metallothionein [Schizophyllum commune H4-8]KAI5898668.1 putative metallothionein [Schizophyllum commune H4-8]
MYSTEIPKNQACGNSTCSCGDKCSCAQGQCQCGSSK